MWSAPTIDGEIAPGEWDNAATYDIANPRTWRKQKQDDSAILPEAFLGDKGLRQILLEPRDRLAPVTLYAMNDGTHLYLAIDNPNDMTMDTYDQMGVYFDDNPLPSDGQWTNTGCGHSDGEGNFWVLTSTVKYREWIAGPESCDVVVPAPGSSGSVGYGSGGHTQIEIAIDLTSSALRATPGDVINMYLWIYDANAGAFDGRWPVVADYQDPSTYRPLTLATCPVPASPSLSSPSNGTSVSGNPPTFRWGSMSGATSYRIQVADNSGFSSPEIDQIISSTSYTPGSALLLNGATYYWRVRASNSGSWSAVWQFTTPAEAPQPTIYLPLVAVGYP